MLDKARSYEELVSKLKESHCPKCELNLFCASGRSGGQSYWCNNCSGYYVPDLRWLVHCSGFPADLPRRSRPFHQGTLAHRSYARAACPICCGQDSLMKEIHGFVAECTEHGR